MSKSAITTLGVLLIVFAAIVLATRPQSLPVGLSDRVKAGQEQKRIFHWMTALTQYAGQNEGVYPKLLDELIPEYSEDREMLRQIKTGRLTYLGGADDSMPGNTVLLQLTLDEPSGSRIVGLLDGSVVLRGLN